MIRRIVLGTLVAGALGVFGALAYSAGWRAGAAAQPAAVIAAMPAQSIPQQQELIPFPMPGPDQQPGQGQGQECEPIILFYHEGRLYQMMPGPDNQPGRPGSPPEYFPLRPYQGPQIPGLPFTRPPAAPQGPGFTPIQPRF